MIRSRFLINDENLPIVDVYKISHPDAPPETHGPVFLLCPHCGHDERDNSGPHEMFDTLFEDRVKGAPLVSSRHFRCRECGEISPVWIIRREGAVTTHMRDAETGEACMPQGFHSAWQNTEP